MKFLAQIALASLLIIGCQQPDKKGWVRINQLGYLPNSIKVAVFGTKYDAGITSFSIHDASTDEEVYSSEKVDAKGSYGPFSNSYRLDFSEFEKEGSYYIMADHIKSPVFKVNWNAYDHSADFLLKYMRQQRCNFNPYLNDSCHQDDGFIIYHPEKPDGTRIDVAGGWHDATDYLQYTATSANAVFQLLLSYRENPVAFGDAHQANGLPGANGVPDILDEAKFGMEWLLKMNPSGTEFYNQIADDRDHAGFRLPTHDSVVYHPDFEGRPVYLATGEIQGLFENKNRATGVASTAAKYASAFSIGVEVFNDLGEEQKELMIEKAKEAFAYGQSHPGAAQTAPCTQPYFYEEDNWADDMTLAAASLYRITKDTVYQKEAMKYAEEEPITPWMGKDTARHYQYYPFYNAGHHELAGASEGEVKRTALDNYKKGLQLIADRGKDNPFLIGVPFIWCSNNYVTATISQARFYRELSGDDQYAYMEAALRDWLFGCNPWGTTMVVGMPGAYDTPLYPHSSLNHLYGYQTDGGLIDGPVYASIFNNLKGLALSREDEYADFQSDVAVYHDDVGDYSTNEPTMDGTACLIYYLSSMEREAAKNGHKKSTLQADQSGAIVRGDRKKKESI